MTRSGIEAGRIHAGPKPIGEGRIESVGFHQFEQRANAGRLVGRVVARGLSDELNDRHYLIVDGVDGRAHYVDIGKDAADQDRCVELFRATGDADLLKWAERHADIIRRFGRFPHRNAVLGRVTTTEEQAFLDSGGFAG